MTLKPLCLIWAASTAALLLGGCQSAQHPSAGTEASEKARQAARTPGEAVPAKAKRPAPVPTTRSVTLPAGTAFTVRTTTALTTKSAKAGDSFTATLEEPLMEGTSLIAPKGAVVEGVVAEADQGGRVKGVASLSVALTSLTTADGRRVEIDTNAVTREAKSTKKKDALKVGVASGIGAAVGAIAGGGKGAAIGAGAGAGAGTGAVLATRGAAAEIPSETVLRFELRHPVTITEKK